MIKKKGFLKVIRDGVSEIFEKPKKAKSKKY